MNFFFLLCFRTPDPPEVISDECIEWTSVGVCVSVCECLVIMCMYICLSMGVRKRMYTYILRVPVCVYNCVLVCVCFVCCVRVYECVVRAVHTLCLHYSRGGRVGVWSSNSPGTPLTSLTPLHSTPTNIPPTQPSPPPTQHFP